MSDVPFTLRDARESDLAYLNAYAAAEGMDDLPSAENLRVAVNEDDVPVGFLRLQQGSNGAAHVNPVVSCATWRGWGVGRALMEEALASRGELRLVARAASVHDSRDGAPSGNAHIALARRVSRSVEIVHGVLLVHCAECCIVSIGEQCFAKPTPVFRLC